MGPCLVIAVTKAASSEVSSIVWDYFLQNGASVGTLVLCNQRAALLFNTKKGSLLLFPGPAFFKLVWFLSEEPLE